MRGRIGALCALVALVSIVVGQTANPTVNPTLAPQTANPTGNPTLAPQTASPTGNPTLAPQTANPTGNPTLAPQTASPTGAPQTPGPTANPTLAPQTASPTVSPTGAPQTPGPTTNPTLNPTVNPTTSEPTSSPTKRPTHNVDCVPFETNVLLTDCPLDEVNLKNGDKVELNFGVVEWDYPFVNKDTGVVEGSIKLYGKGFGLNGGRKTIPGPIIRMDKGAVVWVNLTNDLRPERPGNHDTNIHTHGLHVSSLEDDPAKATEPGNSLEYTYTIPSDHMGGTHWYHPHMHPSSELWLGSGASGMLIVNDRTDGTEIPSVLLTAEEIPLVITHVWPARLLDLADGLTNQNSPRLNFFDATFGLDFSPMGMTFQEGFAAMKPDLFFVNGFYQPKLELEQGRWYRFRILSVTTVQDLKMALYDVTVDNSLSFDYCKAVLVAKDGVYLFGGSRPVQFEEGHTIHLHPANRADIFVRCDGPVGESAEFYDNFNGFTNGLVDPNKNDIIKREKLFTINIVAPVSAPQPIPQHFGFRACFPYYLANLTAAPVAAYGNVTALERQAFLDNGLVRPNYVNNWINGGEYFTISVTPFSLQGASFAEWALAQELAASKRNVSIVYIDEVQDWELTKGSRNHPLHIHVNHFQLQQTIEDGTGYHIKGDYIDTIRPRFDLAVRFRFRPQTFEGKVPLHCHNVDHSDEGAIGQFYITSNPRPQDSRSYSTNRPWGALCSAQVTLTTLAPTAAPTINPTAGPTVAPTLSPSNSPSISPTAAPSLAPVPGATPAPTEAPTLKPTKTPTTSPTRAPSTTPTLAPSQSPTKKPTSTLSVIIDTVEQPLYPHEGLVVASELLRSDPNMEVQYCWTRDSGSEYAVGYDTTLDILDCDATQDNDAALTKIFATSRKTPFLVIQPYALKGGEAYTFRLRITQGDLVDTSDVSFQVNSIPNAGRLSVNPQQGIAGQTRFDFTMTSNQSGLVLNEPLRYRLAIQQNTGDAYVVSVGALQLNPQWSNILLPFTENSLEVSFVSVVAYVQDALGAESEMSVPTFIRMQAPAALSSAQVRSGFDGEIVEQALQAQLSYASILSRLKVLGRTDPLSKLAVLEELNAIMGKLQRSNDFDYQIGEIFMFTLNEITKSLTVSDSDILLNGIVTLFLDVMDLWIAKMETEVTSARANAHFPNLAFSLPDGIIEVAYDTVKELNLLEDFCSKVKGSGTAISDLHTRVSRLALFGQVPGQTAITHSRSSMQTIARKEFANKVSGEYVPPGGLSSITIPESLFFPGPRSKYDTIVVSVYRASNPKTFCGVFDNITTTTTTNQDNTNGGFGSGVLNTPFTEEASVQTVGYEKPYLLNRRRDLETKQFVEYQLLLTDVLHMELIHNSTYFNTESPRLVNITLDVTNLESLVDAKVSPLKCGYFDEAVWTNSNCQIIYNSIAESNNITDFGSIGIDDGLTIGTQVVCTCSSVGSKMNFGAWIDVIQEVADEGPVVWGEFFAIFLPTLLVWLGYSILAHDTDVVDALRAQKASILILLANRGWKQKRGPKNNIFMKREVFRKIENNPGHAQLTREQQMEHQQKTKKYNLSPVQLLLWKAFMQHSLIGSWFYFNSKISRINRSYWVVFLYLAFALNFLFIVEMQMDSVGAMIFSAVFIGVLTVLATLTLTIIATKVEKRDYHTTAHMINKAKQIERFRNQKQFIPDEAELLNRQCQFFMKKMELKRMKEQHDRLMTPFNIFLRRCYDLMWWFPKSEKYKGYRRVYGGKVRVTRKYRRAKMHLQKAALDFDIQTFSWARMAWFFVMFGILFASLFGIARSTTKLEKDSVWLYSSLVGFFLGSVLEFILLMMTSKFIDPLAKPPPLTQVKTNRFSWDSRISTRSLDVRNRLTTIDEVYDDIDDLEKGSRRSRGITKGTSQKSGVGHRTHRNSVYSTGTNKTAKSGISRMLSRYNLFLGTSRHLDEDFEDYSSDEDGYESGHTRKSVAQSVKSAKSAKSAISRNRGKSRFRRPSKFAASIYDSDDSDEGNFRPDDRDFV